VERSIRRSLVSGKITAPASIPMAHRAIVAATLAQGQSVISNFPSSQEVSDTIAACRFFGADIVTDNGVADIFGAEELLPAANVECGTSNTALKLLLPIASLFDYEVKFSGAASLSSRSFAPHIAYLSRLGVSSQSQDGLLPFSITGPMQEHELVYFSRLGMQFFSGLLFALPLREIPTEIGIDGHFPGREYADGAVELMKKCGIKFEVCEEDFIYLDGAQAYSPLADYGVPASQYLSSFSLLAGAIAGRASLSNCASTGSQFSSLLVEFGAHFSASGSSSSSSAGALSGCQLNAPELGKYFPHALVLASLASRVTTIENISVLPKSAGRRLVLMVRELTRMGAKIAEEENKLVITGGKLLGAKIEPEGDSAVAMACSIAALAAEGQTTISGAECVEKSYPNFFKDLASLGAIVR